MTLPRLLAARALLDEQTFRRARHVVTENQRVLDTAAALRADGPAVIGGLLTESHLSLRNDFEISTRELDLAVEASIEAGAIGARMTGGGFGGSAIALAPATLIRRLREAIGEAFSRHGHREPDTFVVAPSPSARRDQ